jgi:hypothetical protein
VNRLLSIDTSDEERHAAKTQSLKWVWVPAKGETAPRKPVIKMMMHELRRAKIKCLFFAGHLDSIHVADA